jgi:hypothetical protein
MGLGCWVSSQTQGWSTTAQSAEQRVCQLMNRSITELDMFRLKPPQWPEAFWIPQLEKFVAGGGCEPAPPPPSLCPADGWVGCGPPGCPSADCCDVSYAGVNMSRCAKGVASHEECAKAQCLASTTKISKWVPENYSQHWFTCCSADTPPPPPPPPAPGDCPAYGWVACTGDDCPSTDCCEESYDAVDMSGCGAAESHEDCSRQQCEASATKVNTWLPRNFSEHWFTCCPKSKARHAGAPRAACAAGESANRCLARAKVPA